MAASSGALPPTNSPPTPSTKEAFHGGEARGGVPDQVRRRVAEETDEDRDGEARIVEFEAEIIATLVRALGPGGADLDPAHEDAVTGALSPDRVDSGTIRTFLA
jgi:hypothetical protein